MKNLVYAFILCTSVAIAQTKVTTYTYAIKGLDTLKMDVYTPKKIKNNDSVPVMIWMHGGGFVGGARNYPSEVKLGEMAAEKGYLAVFISYRLTRKGQATGFGCDCPKADKLSTFKSATIDFLDAAKFIIDNKKLLGADVSKIIAGGSSAGAEGMLNAVYMREYFVDDLKKYNDVKFAGVFSLAGAMVNADYVTKENALPSVFFHGTADAIVPFASAPHQMCKPEKKGYIMLDGSATIVDRLLELQMPYYFYKVIGGKHELSSIPFSQLENVFSFFNRTIFNKEIIQTVQIINKL
ncbi:carboxylesterase family protein [Gelidibacter sediminis]|uniref:Carboxylesterase family protein n=1 Tax=Gelidibacter sediminis TaxID=1608710 RepID=A0A4R7Q1D8_9FLAO|nr:carboxylesterase family protein [Gelidibacter sediminis]TDU40311.1 carboxylesterase family protein [Gelidibacter sediminis]